MKPFKRIKKLPEDAVFDDMTSPVGKLTIIAALEGLYAVLWDNDREDPNCKKMIERLARCKNEKTILKTKKQFTEYFEGKRKVFDLPLVLNGTDFQMKAWQQLRNIPYAETITYGEQAEQIGNKNKARAVGLANGLNPVSIIIPCHRVIGSNGKLVGFGGGLTRKRWLINHEKNLQDAKLWK